MANYISYGPEMENGLQEDNVVALTVNILCQKILKKSDRCHLFSSNKFG
jgi:hypothetical protein